MPMGQNNRGGGTYQRREEGYLWRRGWEMEVYGKEEGEEGSASWEEGKC